MKSSLPLSWEHFNSSHQETEKNISNRSGSYKHLSVEALYTSFEDLQEIFRSPLMSGIFLDIGCGHGMSALVYGHLFPERKSSGIEFEAERLLVGEIFKLKHELDNVDLIQADLLHVKIPEADTYFLYFPTGPVLDRILTELYHIKKSFHLIAIESHGDLFPRLELENWLTLVNEIPLRSPRHHPFARIFQKNPEIRNSVSFPLTLSYHHHYLLIEDAKEIWLGDTFGMEWTENDRYELLTPPRTIFWKNVKKTMILDDLDKRLHLLTTLRLNGEVTLSTVRAVYQGFIRKIVISPTFRVEISTGEQVEWREILTITQGQLLCYESSSDF